ncbi:MAG: transcription termination/antitermination protein NusG [Thermoguttaceae bacterium]
MSDEPNNPTEQPADLSQKIAYAAGPDPAELAAEAEGMPVSAEPAAAEQPQAETAPVLPEVTPAPAEAAIPYTQAPVAETRQPASVVETAPAPAPVVKPQEPKSDKMEWYILKVQSNREESIREGLLRRVAIAGLDRYFGDVIVPTEKVTEFKGGKKRVIKRKLYPGYLVVHMEINDDTWFLVRETPGIGDFTGAAGRPSVMLPHEVQRIVAKAEEKSEKAPKLKIGFNEGERVKIKEGTFENFEGEVESIDQTNGQVTVMINIFGRSTPVTLEYWQIETL